MSLVDSAILGRCRPFRFRPPRLGTESWTDTKTLPLTDLVHPPSLADRKMAALRLLALLALAACAAAAKVTNKVFFGA